MDYISITASVVSIAIAFLSVGISIFTYRQTMRRDRKQATLEAYNRLQSEVFDALNTYSPAEIESICEDKRSEEYKILSGYLARIEHFCVGINEKIYDWDVFYAMAHGYFDGYILRKRIEPIIDSKHTGTGGDELFYTDTQTVLKKMSKKPKKEDLK